MSNYATSIRLTILDDASNYCPSASTNVNDEYIGRVELNTINNASLGLDPNYDSGLFGASPTFALYSHLVGDNKGPNYGIQSIDSTNLSIVTIPLGIHISEGQRATISITVTTLPEYVEVYLADNLTNTFTLLNSSDFVFTANTNLT